MTKNYKSYWQRHPFQMRLLACLILLLLPLFVVVYLIADNWEDIRDAAKDLFADAFLSHKSKR
jgi:hypothetical protein